MKLSEMVDVNRIKEVARQRERVRAQLESLIEHGVSECVNTDTGRSYTIPEDLRPVIIRMLVEALTKKGQKLDDELAIHGIIIDLPLIAPRDQPPLDSPSDAGVRHPVHKHQYNYSPIDDGYTCSCGHFVTSLDATTKGLK